MLNYGYAILDNQVDMQVVAAGLDPKIGILHRSSRGKHGLVYDLMELPRPVIDRKVLEFAQADKFHPADFTIGSNGVCRQIQRWRAIWSRLLPYAASTRVQFKRSKAMILITVAEGLEVRERGLASPVPSQAIQRQKIR